MSITYRTDGAWGAGKGADLTAAEIDGNFWELVQQIAASAGADGNGIANIIQDGSQMTIVMDDATQYIITLPRPVQRPTATKVISTDTYSIIPADSMTLLRCTHVDGCEITIDDIDLPVDAEFNVWLDSDGLVTFDAGSGVFFVPPPAGKANAISVRGHSVTCKKVSDTTDGAEWYIFGGLASDVTA